MTPGAGFPEIEGFRPLTLDDREVVEAALRRTPPETSELTFTNLFIWRHHYRPLLGRVGDALAVVCAPENGEVFALPPFGSGSPAAALDRLFEVLGTAGARPVIRRAGEDFVRNAVDPDRYLAMEDRDQADYLYLAADLISLSGRKLHQKKNHLNRFLGRYAYEIRELDAELTARVLDMQNAWCEVRACALDPGLAGENRAVYEALTHFGALGYRGLAMLIDGRVEAFALGEELNPETAVIHVEKANPEIDGLYAAVNQFFCRDFWSGYRYINREQDLGVEGLRQAKSSYKPLRLVMKYDVWLK